ncbi:acyl-CoA N-acyltransferase [Agrocybe pediades]|nr:acyl-CoA N-acyltransferase [Agrocybe pediades]
MYNNADVAPLVSDAYPVPQGQKFLDKMKSAIESDVSEMFFMIETIPDTPEKDSDSPNKPEFVGFVSLWARGERGNRHSIFGISFMPKFWGKGYGTEVTKFVLKHAFVQLNMHRISLQVYEGNERAIAVYKQVGFIQEGVMRKTRWSNGRWIDEIQMGILVDDWRKLQEESVHEESSQE